MALLRLIWWAAVAGLTAVSLTGLIIAALLAAVLVVAALTALVHFTNALIGVPGVPRKPRSQCASNAAVSATVVLLAAGLIAVAGPNAVPLLILVAATSPPATRLYAARLPKPPEQAQSSRLAPADPADADSPIPSAPTIAPSTGAVNATLTDEELCQAWRTSYLTLERATNPGELARIAATRQGYLDELEHRHPTAFNQWITTGARAASNPARYLTPTPQEPQTRKP